MIPKNTLSQWEITYYLTLKFTYFYEMNKCLLRTLGWEEVVPCTHTVVHSRSQHLSLLNFTGTRHTHGTHTHRKQNMNALIHKTDTPKKEKKLGMGKGTHCFSVAVTKQGNLKQFRKGRVYLGWQLQRGSLGTRGLAGGTHSTGSWELTAHTHKINQNKRYSAERIPKEFYKNET